MGKLTEKRLRLTEQTSPGTVTGGDKATRRGDHPIAEGGGTEGFSVHECEMRALVEQMLDKRLGRRVKITSLERNPSPFATLFPTEVLSITLESGERTSIFLKHLGPEESDHPEKQRRDREVCVYEELLSNDDLPVVRYYGSRWNEGTNRREVFLEHIDDWSLEYQELDHWFTAARRLAHLHAYFAARAEKLATCDFLLHFDAAYLYEWAHRALMVVAGQSSELAGKLEGVVGRYDRVVETISQQPLTLVHNDPSPKNVIADRSSTPARICFVDWEMAGVGCGLLDLVHLKYGLDERNDQVMCAAYCEELDGRGLLPASHRERDALFAACDLHKTVYRLAFSKTWQIPIERVAQWVAETQQFLARV
ncbi:MAG: phosphotransferase [Chloroflexi bacterium]|nr:phosphotransferase [Chloroflexota bacterium]